MSRLGTLAAILQPLKAWGDRIALFGFLLVAFALVAIERSNPDFAGTGAGRGIRPGGAGPEPAVGTVGGHGAGNRQRAGNQRHAGGE